MLWTTSLKLMIESLGVQLYFFIFFSLGLLDVLLSSFLVKQNQIS